MVFYLYICTPEEREHQIPWDYSYRQLWGTMWVLGIELATSGGTASALNCLAIALAPNYLSFCKDNGKENVCPALTCSSPVGSVVSLAPPVVCSWHWPFSLQISFTMRLTFVEKHQIHCRHFGMVLAWVLILLAVFGKVKPYLILVAR